MDPGSIIHRGPFSKHQRGLHETAIDSIHSIQSMMTGIIMALVEKCINNDCYLQNL